MNFLKFMLRFGVGILTTSLIACSSAPTTSNATSNPDSMVAQSQTMPSAATDSMVAQSQTAPSSAVELPAPIWQIDWRACGVLSPFNVSVQGCLPDMRINRDSPLYQGEEPTILMWADRVQAPEDIHIETENSSFGGVRAHLFVRSKGCVARPIGAEDFYYTGISAQISTRRAREGTPLPQAQWTVTPRQLSQQAATEVIEQVQAQLAARDQFPRYQLSGTRGVCLPLEQWRSR